MESDSSQKGREGKEVKGGPSFGGGTFVPPPENPREKSSLEELEKRLYKRSTNTNFEAFRSRLARRPLNSTHLPFSPRDAQKRIAQKAQESEPFLSPLLMKVLLFSILFFLVVLGFFGYIYFGSGTPRGNSDAIALSVSGPVAISGGAVATFQMVFENRGSLDIASSDMTVVFPPGTRSADNQEKELTRMLQDIGPLKRGERVSKTVKAIFFGTENSQKEITVEYDYQAVNSNATFQKTKAYDLTVSGSPLSLTTTLPATIASGHSVAFDLKVSSNASLPLAHVIVDVSFPPGFSLTKSVPEVSLAQHVWQLGDIAPGQATSIHIEGILQGENAEQKLFRFVAGTAKVDDEAVVAAPYGAVDQTVALERPALSITAFIDGAASASPSIEDAHDTTVLATLENNTADPIHDLKVVAKLSGALINKSAIAASRGFYDSSTNSIRWDASTLQNLKEFAPGGSLDLDFVLGTFSANRSGAITKNPSFSFDIEAQGTRTVAGGGDEVVQEKISRTVNVSTVATFVSRDFYSTGAFANHGPYPPKVEKETTYTVTWSVGNTSNDLSDATARAVLPTYVNWLGVTSPGSELVTWKEDSREIIWNAGSVSSGAGYTLPAKQVSFQLSFKPSLSQKGQTPILLDGQRFTATDNFTNAHIEGIKSALTTELVADPTYTGDGRVTQ